MIFATIPKFLHTITKVSSDHVFVMVKNGHKHYKANLQLYLSSLFMYLGVFIQGVTGGMDKTSGECSLC